MSEAIVIAGIGQTAFGHLAGRDDISLNVEACRLALQDAGIGKNEVDGLLVKVPSSGYKKLYGQRVAEAMGMQPLMGGSWDEGGSTPIMLIHLAAMAIQAGHAEVVLVTAADTPRSSDRTNLHRALTPEAAAYGYFGVAAGYAMIARSHMEQYGTTSEQLGAIAEVCRRHGAANPAAQLRKAITIDDHQNSPWVIDPLRRDDCCLVSDGGAAVVVMSESRAKKYGVHHPVRIAGVGHAQTSWDVHLRPQITASLAGLSAAKAFSEAGIGPSAIDVAQIYDCFTITALMTLEEYGFCRVGEGGPFAASGALHLDGVLPMNTSGGLLSESGMPGSQLITEAVRQLRGESPNQVSGAKNCIVSNQGGNMHTHATMILST